MTRFWNTSRYPPKPLTTSCPVKVIRRHDIEKDQNVNFGFGWRFNVLGQIYSHKQSKKWPETHFERPKRRKEDENRKNTEIARNRFKSGLFTLKVAKLGRFSGYRYGILYTYAPTRVLSHNSVFLKIQKSFEKFGKIIPPNFKIFSKCRIR